MTDPHPVDLSVWRTDEERRLSKEARSMGRAGEPDVILGPLLEEPNAISELRSQIDQFCHGFQQDFANRLAPITQRMGRTFEKLGDPLPVEEIDLKQRTELELRLEEDWRLAQSIPVELRAVLEQTVEAGNGLGQRFAAELQKSHPHPSLVDSLWMFEPIRFPDDCMEIGFAETQRIQDAWAAHRAKLEQEGEEE